MKTSSYKEATLLEGRISISRGPPRGYRAGYRIFKALAPGAWFNSAPPDVYVRRFKDEVLAHLDPAKTFQQLVDLAAPNEPILLCFEQAPLTGLDGENWCHRRIVAEWFQEKLKIEVPELNQPGTPVLVGAWSGSEGSNLHPGGNPSAGHPGRRMSQITLL